MNKKLVNLKKDGKKCSCCKYGKPSADKESILCIKKGVMDPDDHCHSFNYDPLRRVPRKAPKPAKFEQSDFEL